MSGYITVRKYASFEYEDRKSVFIGEAAPVSTEEDAIRFIEAVKKKYPDASHHVYAYVLRENSIMRYSDDREPQGTAGMPVLDVARKRGITDVVITVTRYFGGILLGGGGLVRAYSTSAKLVVEDAGILDMCECYRTEIHMDYNMYSKVSYFLPQYEIKELSSKFEDEVFMEVLVKEQYFEPLRAKLIDVSNGKIDIEKSEKLFEDFSEMA